MAIRERMAADPHGEMGIASEFADPSWLEIGVEAVVWEEVMV